MFVVKLLGLYKRFFLVLLYWCWSWVFGFAVSVFQIITFPYLVIFKVKHLIYLLKSKYCFKKTYKGEKRRFSKNLGLGLVLIN